VTPGEDGDARAPRTVTPGAQTHSRRARQHGSPVAVTRSGPGSLGPPIPQRGLGRRPVEASAARSPGPALERRRRLAMMARPPTVRLRSRRDRPRRAPSPPSPGVTEFPVSRHPFTPPAPQPWMR
jgi:hypothetical protein